MKSLYQRNFIAKCPKNNWPETLCPEKFSKLLISESLCRECFHVIREIEKLRGSARLQKFLSTKVFFFKVQYHLVGSTSFLKIVRAFFFTDAVPSAQLTSLFFYFCKIFSFNIHKHIYYCKELVTSVILLTFSALKLTDFTIIIVWITNFRVWTKFFLPINPFSLNIFFVDVFCFIFIVEENYKKSVRKDFS